MLLRRKLRLTYFSVRMQQKRRRAKHTATIENVTVTLTDMVTGEYFISQLFFELRQLWGIALFHQNLSTQKIHPHQLGTDVSGTLLPCSALLLNGSHHVPVRISFPITPRPKMHSFKLPKPRRCISIGTATVLQSQSDTEHKAPRRAQARTKSKIMSDQVLSEVGKGGGGVDGYTSLFTGHFLWLSLGGIIRQTNSSQRLGDVTQDPKKRKKKKKKALHAMSSFN